MPAEGTNGHLFTALKHRAFHNEVLHALFQRQGVYACHCKLMVIS